MLSDAKWAEAGAAGGNLPAEGQDAATGSAPHRFGLSLAASERSQMALRAGRTRTQGLYAKPLQDT